MCDSRSAFHLAICSEGKSDRGTSVVRQWYPEFGSTLRGHFDIAVPQMFSIRHRLSDAHQSVLGFLADYIHRITGDLVEEVMEPKSEHCARVVRGESWNEMLNLVVDAHYDGNSVLARIQLGFHGSE
jgi:hypothetical protein